MIVAFLPFILLLVGGAGSYVIDRHLKNNFLSRFAFNLICALSFFLHLAGGVLALIYLTVR
ncbi:hypothetical protein V9K67_21635 [Paraflavisolibacter sp. H34]|uniref:hypothetical protein n=1 Tax=Huijunlia imazamoxiresistens TaxID=3127457 RepID=UPI00301AB45D